MAIDPRQMMGQGAPPIPAMPPGMDAAMGKFNPTAGAPTAQGPDQAAQRAYTDAMASGQGDPMIAATAAWKQAAREAADPSIPDAPGSENLRTIQQHLVQTQGMDPLAAWAMAHETLPALAARAPAPGGPRG